MRLNNGDVVLCWPLALHVLTAGYFYSDGSRHEAIDLRTNQGGSVVKPVYAAEDGTVEETQTWDGHTKTGMQSYGTMIRIRHGDYRGVTLQTRYAHLSRLCVSKGQTVKEGQLIGYTGETGNISGAHLHFEVILAGTRRNPLVWLDDDFTTANDGVYTYRPGEHAAVMPAEPEAPAYAPARLQTITIGPVTQGTPTLFWPCARSAAWTSWGCTARSGPRRWGDSRGQSDGCAGGGPAAADRLLRLGGGPADPQPQGGKSPAGWGQGPFAGQGHRPGTALHRRKGGAALRGGNPAQLL